MTQRLIYRLIKRLNLIRSKLFIGLVIEELIKGKLVNKGLVIIELLFIKRLIKRSSSVNRNRSL